MRRSAQEPQEGAFTLVEILTVVLILTILTAVAVPMFLNQKRAAGDAALHIDMHNVAMEITHWQHKHTNQEFREAANGETIYVVDPNADFGYKRATEDSPTGVRYWEDVPGNDYLNISDGAVVEIIVRTDEGRAYTTPEDAFCLTGVAKGSNYDHMIGGGGAGSTAPGGYFTEMLYYDSVQGGAFTIEQLEAMDGSDTSPCGEHVKGYRAMLAVDGLTP